MNEIVAKYVFGELTLKDIFPLVENCDSITLVQMTLKAGTSPTTWVKFTMDDEFGLELWNNIHDDTAVHRFDPGIKVKVKNDHVEMSHLDGFISSLYFNKHQPIQFDIL
jgi:hypothetical protein